MKKYLVYFLLPLALAACTDSDGGAIDDTPKDKYADYQITGSINPIHTTARVVDGEVETKFQENDVMLIGWKHSSGGAYSGYAYKYGSGEMFIPNDNVDGSALWTGLDSEGSNVDVYAWYRKGIDNTSTIPVGNTVSVSEDQSTEAKYTSNICLAAYALYIKNATTSLQFGFSHLMARLKLSIDFNDKGISTSDVQGATVTTKLCISGTLQENTTGKYLKLVSPTDFKAVTMLSQGAAGSYHLDCTCLLPPQTLTSDATIITITLGSGKKYTCRLGKELTLQAGEEAKLPIEITVGGTSVYEPVVTVVPDTRVSSYSGNRLITGNTDNTVSIYEKQADGSWGIPVKVYKSLNEDEVFVAAKTASDGASRSISKIDIYKDYAAVATGTSEPNSKKGDKTYFCKRDKASGKWYMVSDLEQGSYALGINEHFMVCGYNAGKGGDGNSTFIYPITDDGVLQKSTEIEYTVIDGFKLSLAENDVLCCSTAAYALSTNSTGTVITNQLLTYRGVRLATDGYKVIIQKPSDIGGGIAIYNLTTRQEETITNSINAGVGMPLAISGNYVLIGNVTDETSKGSADYACLFYYNGTQWDRAGSNKSDKNNLLTLLKTYAPNKDLENVTSFVGNNLSMKGTRAVINSGGKTYFIENIDELVNKWLSSANN